MLSSDLDALCIIFILTTSMCALVKRRNFAKFAGASVAAMAAGCLGGGDDGDSGGGGGGSDGGDGGGGGDSTYGDLSDGERPMEWIGIPPFVREGQNNKFTNTFGPEIDATGTDAGTAQQQVMSGTVFDAVALDATVKPAFVQNDVVEPIPADSLTGWNEQNIADMFWEPTERLSHIGKQAERMANIEYGGTAEADVGSKDELYHHPQAFNLDAIAYNPSFVENANKWGALFDDQYKGKVAFDAIAPIGGMEVMAHLMAKEIIDPDIDNINTPTKDQIDTIVDWVTEEKKSGQFRVTWTASGNSVNLMASEEVILGDLWQPASLDVRRAGTPTRYADMAGGFNGYRFWYSSVSPIKPHARDRNNFEEVTALTDMHYMAWFPRFIQRWGYHVGHWSNDDIVRTGEDQTGKGMGAEYYDWAHKGTPTYEPIDNPALFVPEEYDWSFEEGEPDSEGQKRDGGALDKRVDKISVFQIFPPNGSYLLEKWNDFTSA